jgi:hypothetical protein
MHVPNIVPLQVAVAGCPFEHGVPMHAFVSMPVQVPVTVAPGCCIIVLGPPVSSSPLLPQAIKQLEANKNAHTRPTRTESNITAPSCATERPALGRLALICRRAAARRGDAIGIHSPRPLHRSASALT